MAAKDAVTVEMTKVAVTNKDLGNKAKEHQTIESGKQFTLSLLCSLLTLSSRMLTLATKSGGNRSCTTSV